MSDWEDIEALIYFHPPARVAISVIYSMRLSKVC